MGSSPSNVYPDMRNIVGEAMPLKAQFTGRITAIIERRELTKQETASVVRLSEFKLFPDFSRSTPFCKFCASRGNRLSPRSTE